MFGSIVTSPLSSLSPKQAVCLANVYLEKACSIDDPDVALVLCHNTKVALSKAKKAARRKEDKAVAKDIAITYVDLGKQLEERGHGREAQVSYKKAEKLGVNVQGCNRASKSSRPNAILKPLKGPSLITEDQRPPDVPIHPSKNLLQQQHRDVEVPTHIFAENVRLPTVKFRFPEADERLDSTLQLANCLGILQAACSVEETLEPAAHKWLQAIEKDPDEQERLRTMATEVVRVFKRDELKDAKAVAEVVVLSPVLPKDAFHDLLGEFYSGIDHSGLLNVHHLVGLAQLIQGAHPGFLDADYLIKILDLLSERLRDTHNQSTTHIHQLTLAVSNVLDAMVDTKVTGLSREKLHEPLSDYLGSLTNSSDPYLVYQAAYAYQALLCVPDNETKWHATLRRTRKVVQGVSGLVSAVKGVDLNKFIEGLEDIQKGLSGVSEVVEAVKTAYENVCSLAEGGKGFLSCLQEGLSFDRKREWYSALRGTDMLLRDGNLALFKELVYKAPCRLDLAFQWGVCQRLGEIAANSMWDAEIRRGAIGFLGDIYRDDDIWGQQTSVKQWIVNILMQLSRPSGTGLQN
ncbi:hypothetical protein BGX34_010486 [Mortierella sp. NVP85]|nr:hypothetical protein BGX34_010486 [Mortierella sp. NVP85]